MLLSRLSRPSGAPDRRSTSRQKVAHPAKLLQGVHAQEGRITDISAGGARVSSLRTLPARGSRLVLVDFVAGFGHEGEVAWAKDGEAGIRFVQSRDLRGLVP